MVNINAFLRKYENLKGKPLRDIMPRLAKEGRYPISISKSMEERLNVLQVEGGDRLILYNLTNLWWNETIVTGDAVFRDPSSGKFKIELSSRTMRDINSKSKIYRGVLVVSKEAYNQIEGPEFTEEEVSKYTERGLYLEDLSIFQNPILNELVPNSELLEKYARAVFDDLNNNFKGDIIDGIIPLGLRRIPEPDCGKDMCFGSFLTIAPVRGSFRLDPGEPRCSPIISEINCASFKENTELLYGNFFVEK
ncbi:MAG: hypothetical protein PHT54_00265 [Candidatus Nanoarchaeia archaeon]|nr:hypothetical protein [Candidatus Nanoarchaeia archaeon]